MFSDSIASVLHISLLANCIIKSFFAFFDTGPVLSSDQRANPHALRGWSFPVWHPAAKHLPCCATSVSLPVAVQRPPQSQPVRQRQGLRQSAGHLDWQGERCFTGLWTYRYDVLLTYSSLQSYSWTVIKGTSVNLSSLHYRFKAASFEPNFINNINGTGRFKICQFCRFHHSCFCSVLFGYITFYFDNFE